MKHDTTNGLVTYEVKSGVKTNVLTRRGRITAKRVSNVNRTWNRNTGKQVSVHRPGAVFMRLISYQLDGNDEVHHVLNQYNHEIHNVPG